MNDEPRRRKVAVTLDPDLADLVEQEARRERSTASAVVRALVARWYADQAPERTAAA